MELVGVEKLEFTRLVGCDFKECASTDSATHPIGRGRKQGITLL